jgi:hypothetical protein
MTDELVIIGNPQPSGAASVGAMTQERPSATIVAALTVDPGTTNPGTFTFTSTAVFTTAFGTGQFKIKVENEIGLAVVASGTTLTVIRGQDGTTNAAHGIGKTVAALGLVQYVAPISSRSVSFCGALASFRTLGNAATPQNIFSIENAGGSAVILGVSRLTVEMDATAALLTVASEFKTSRPTALPTGGTALTKVAIDTALTSSASVVARGATASDGGAATAITATAGSTMWHQYLLRQQTLVAQYEPTDYSLLPTDIADVDWVIVRAGEALLVQVVGTAGSNAATNHYVIKCAFFEYTVP